jgi:hypothetical protein
MTIHYGLTEAEYEALPALRASTIRAVHANPAKYKNSLDKPSSEKHFTLGSATHALALDNARNVVLALKGGQVPGAPLTDWRTKEARTIRDTALAAGKYPLTAPELDEAAAMAAAIAGDPRVADHIRAGQHEVTITGIDHVTFTALKARLDVLDLENRTIVEIKTCASADPDDFPSTVRRYGYDISAVQYIDLVAQATGTSPDEWTFLFALVEKGDPHLTHVTQLDSEYLAIGARARRKGIDRYLECERTGVWPGYSTQITTTSPPRWVREAAI